MPRRFEFWFTLSCLSMVATSYGLARYAYGLFLPAFRNDLELTDAQLALIGSASYGSYFVASILAIGLSKRLPPRLSIGLGGLLASAGMLGVAYSSTAHHLLIAVSIAGVSPCLAYMPMSTLVASYIEASRQQRVYSFINSGTSLGVLLSGPIAIWFSQAWPTAWVLFAVFGLAATVFALAVVPATAASTSSGSGAFRLADLTIPGSLGLQLFTFVCGSAISVYWTFSADLVSQGQPVGGQFERVFWMFVGVSGFVGAAAGHIVRAVGLHMSTRIFLMAVAVAVGILPLMKGPVAVLASGSLFGAGFILLSAAMGMWAMELYKANPTAGFGLTFLTLSAGQFVGPMAVGLLAERIEVDDFFLFAACVMAAMALAQDLLLGSRSRIQAS